MSNQASYSCKRNKKNKPADLDFGKMKGLFEISRPNKSPSATLPKSSSAQFHDLNQRSPNASENEFKEVRERIFQRNSLTRTSTRSRHGTKLKRESAKQCHKKYLRESETAEKQINDNVERNNLLVEKFGEILNDKVRQKQTDDEDNNNNVSSCAEAYVRDNTYHDAIQTTKKYDFCERTLDSDELYRTTYDITIDDSEFTEEVAKKGQIEMAHKDVDKVTEMYRKSLLLEMDLEVAKMKKDGFLDNKEDPEKLSNDMDNAKEEERMKEKEDMDNEKLLSAIFSNKLNDHYKKSKIINNFIDFEDFGKNLFDNLENGEYYVEAFNDENRELCIVEISVERKHIDFSNSFSNIKKSLEECMKESNITFYCKNDNIINVVENADELAKENHNFCSDLDQDDNTRIPSTSSFFDTISLDSNSNRSTIYSVDEVVNEDDEGIEIGIADPSHNIQSVPYKNCKRETISDTKGIVRIERICYPEMNKPNILVERNDSITQRKKLSYIIEEIKSTEKKYVQDLHKVVTEYKPYIEENTPTHLLGKSCYVFGNIERIFHYQRKFLDDLENSGENVDDVLKVFLKHDRLFALYPPYFKNKPKAETYLKEFSEIIKEKFNDRLDLPAYLLSPIQRLGKYKLLLESIVKDLRKQGLPTGLASCAVELVKGEMSKGNDFVAIASIGKSPIEKFEYGSIKMREQFTIIKPKRLDSMVFLFENIIVFTLVDPQNIEIFTYYNHIKMNDLRIRTFEDLTIHLTDFTKTKKVFNTKKRFTFVIEAKNEKIKETWQRAIENILWRQLEDAKEKTLKQFQDGVPKEIMQNIHLRAASKKRSKSIGSSTFYG